MESSLEKCALKGNADTRYTEGMEYVRRCPGTTRAGGIRECL
jgi:hypothetical protein